jgi:hypothetical protein
VGLAAAGVVATTALGVVGWVTVPDKATTWVFMIAFLPLFWAFIETATKERTEATRAILRVHRLLIAALSLLVVVDAGSDLAIHVGLLDPDANLVARRFSGLFKGALFALWGNHIPKLMSPWSLQREPFDWQGVHRFVGRIAVVAGLGGILVWSTLPVEAATRATELLVVVACVLGVGYKAISVVRYSGRERPTHR